jgi:hypothetical protein
MCRFVLSKRPGDVTERGARRCSWCEEQWSVGALRDSTSGATHGSSLWSALTFAPATPLS